MIWDNRGEKIGITLPDEKGRRSEMNMQQKEEEGGEIEEKSGMGGVGKKHHILLCFGYGWIQQ